MVTAAILIMLKVPRPGQVKTRLCPPLEREEAALLAACLAQDTLSKVRLLAIPVLLAFTPADGEIELLGLVGPAQGWIVQRGSHLGERLENALEEAWAKAFGPLLVVGTDSPTLPLAFLEKALEALGRADVVLGPSEDGGFYLLGLAHPQPGLLRDISWSTEAVLQETLANVKGLGLTVEMLPPWYDIDSPPDLSRLARELASEPQRAPQTAAWLEKR